MTTAPNLMGFRITNWLNLLIAWVPSKTQTPITATGGCVRFHLVGEGPLAQLLRERRTGGWALITETLACENEQRFGGRIQSSHGCHRGIARDGGSCPNRFS